jgi:hypothetical protein
VEAAPVLIDELVWYLYGFVANPVEPAAAAAVDADGALLVIGSRGVACIASPVAAADYERPPDAASPAEQLAWVTPRATRHHDVVGRVHRAATMVPLKFGTLCADIEHVHTLLARLGGPIGNLLERFARKDEWTLRVSVDRPAISALAQDCEPALVHLRSEAARLPDGQAFFARKKLAAMTAARVAERIAILAQQVDERLAALSLDSLAAERADRTGDRSLLVTDLALLVDRHRFSALDDALGALESEHADVHLCCELRGPWPPYTFATALMAADDADSHTEGR